MSKNVAVDVDLGGAPAQFETAARGAPVIEVKPVDPEVAVKQAAWLAECDGKYKAGGSRTHVANYADPLSRVSTGPSDNLSL